MKILDKYILFKFLKTFVFVVAILIAVICVIDYTEKSDDFLEHKLSFSQVFFEYYLNYIPFMANTLSPICVFITTVFMTSRMASHTEIVAMMSSGMSFRRLLMPYWAGSILLGIITFFMVGWIIPKAAKTKVDFEIAYVKSPFFFNDRNIHLRENDSIYVYMESYNNRSKSGYKFTMEKVIGRDLKEKLYGDRIQWVDSLEGWHLKSYEIHHFDGKKEWMTRGTKLDTVLTLHPKDFESKHKIFETLTFNELDQYINEQLARGLGNVGRLQNEKYERYAYPFAIIILTTMGVIVSARKSRRGTGFQIAFGFLMAFIYIIFVILSRNIAKSGAIPPIITAWIPNMTFTSITALLYYFMPK
ncbi:MAG: LptF/LptG family permease [Flammeovirgaceae bacterium]